MITSDPKNRGMLIATLVWIASMLIQACGQLPIQTVPSGAFAADTVLDERAILGHLRRLNSQEIDGRSTGTVGFVRAAAYASDMFASFGMASLAGSGFHSFYTTALSVPGEVVLRRLTRDTLEVRLGGGMLGHGRSVADSVRFRTLIWNPGPNETVRNQVVVVPVSEADDSALLSLAGRGAKAVLIEGPLVLHHHARPFSSLVVASIQSETLNQIVGIPPRETSTIDLPFEIELQTTAVSVSDATAINVMALVPGGHPVLRNELVIVSASLDGYGSVGDLQLTDGTDLAVGAAALLESARLLSGLQRWSRALDRSILFILWSGTKLGHAGAQSFFDLPPWPVNAITSVLFLTADLKGVEPYRRIVARSGIDFTAVTPTTARMSAKINNRREFLFYQDLTKDATELTRAALSFAREKSRWN
ncbi:MAG: hypothetical protein BMS9Abin05_0878 [Rhodothermia bacterium]|nr:MAG: hypothetical protein BMS9Abin05_0878 [Rhodothermia bacterium]